MSDYRRCHEVAQHARADGISVVPAAEDGSKRPLAEIPPRNCEDPECIAFRKAGKKSWKHRQHRRAGEAFIDRWFEVEERTGLCFVCGKISNGLFLFEFEGRAMDDGTFDDFLASPSNRALGTWLNDSVVVTRRSHRQVAGTGSGIQTNP